MIITNYGYAECSIKTALKETTDILNEVYPNIKSEDKYFLFVKSTMYFPDEVYDIKCELKLLDVNKNVIRQSEKYKIRTPYPNKYVYLNSMKHGRKMCDDGFIFMFDSFNDLCKITNVEICWVTKTKYDSGKPRNLWNKIIYNNKFISKEGNNVFVINSRDSYSESFKKGEDVKRYMSQFDKNDYSVVKANKEINDIFKEHLNTPVEIDTYMELHIQNLELIADNTRAKII
jgi:hypothetical protein